MPEVFFSFWFDYISEQLKLFSSELKVKLKQEEKILSLVFLSEKNMLNLNLKFRNKKKVTDVLSFEGPSSQFFGEILLCPQFILKHRFQSFHKDCAYLILHAFLHLLGFDHEKSKKEEELMYSLQDKIFFEGIEKIEKKAKIFISKRKKKKKK